VAALFYGEPVAPPEVVDLWDDDTRVLRARRLA
jgi:hypothetical protein